MNGKGIYYYSNGNIKYEGDWVNDDLEGYGKYICEDGEYYIGQWNIFPISWKRNRIWFIRKPNIFRKDC